MYARTTLLCLYFNPVHNGVHTFDIDRSNVFHLSLLELNRSISVFVFVQTRGNFWSHENHIFYINVCMHAECLWLSHCFKCTNTNIRARQLASVYTCSMDEIKQYAVSCTCQFFNRRRYLHILHNHYEQVDSFEILQFGCFLFCVGNGGMWWKSATISTASKCFMSETTKNHHHNSHQYHIYIPWKMGKV